MKQYTLFLKLIQKGDVFWYSWKKYSTPEVAMQAFKDIRKCWTNRIAKIGKIAKISGGGSTTYYEEQGGCTDDL